MHVRVCVDCGEEYRPDVQACADCGGRLEDRFEDAPRPRKEPEVKKTPAIDLSGHTEVFVARQASHVLDAAEALREAGLSSRIVEATEGPEKQPTFRLFVRQEDAPQAVRALAPFHGFEGDPDQLLAVDSGFEPGLGYAQCPACGSNVPAGAKECPECGLLLGAEEDGDKVG